MLLFLDVSKFNSKCYFSEGSMKLSKHQALKIQFDSTLKFLKLQAWLETEQTLQLSMNQDEHKRITKCKVVNEKKYKINWNEKQDLITIT